MSRKQRAEWVCVIFVETMNSLCFLADESSTAHTQNMCGFTFLLILSVADEFHWIANHMSNRKCVGILLLFGSREYSANAVDTPVWSNFALFRRERKTASVGSCITRVNVRRIPLPPGQDIRPISKFGKIALQVIGKLDYWCLSNLGCKENRCS